MKLVLFLTYGLSLDAWKKAGILHRELSLYRKLTKEGIEVHLVSYGGIGEVRYRDILDGMKLWRNVFSLPNRIYARGICQLAPWIWDAKTIFKSNQLDGANWAMEAARRCNAPFVARMGYLPSLFYANEEGHRSPKAMTYEEMEDRVLNCATRVVVTTSQLRDHIVEKYKVEREKVCVIPNYVQTDVFAPAPWGIRDPRRICFVGRLHKQKDPFLLFQAVKGLDVELWMVGEGPLRGRLEHMAAKTDLQVKFWGRVSHGRLPEILNACSIFVMPSRWEGHPKALLEAMSCGLAVLGTNVPGIEELITDGVTGVLCSPDPEALRQSLERLLRDPDLCQRLGRLARQFVVERFDLNHVMKMELELLRSLGVSN